MLKKSAILYTDNRLSGPVFNMCIFTITLATHKETPVVAVQSWGNEHIAAQVLLGAHWTQHIHQGERGLRDCYEKIYKGLENTDAEVVYLLEHDVLYPPSYFAFTPDAQGFYFNRNIYRMNHAGYFDFGVPVTSNCCATRDNFLKCYEMRLGWLDAGKRIVWDEPGRMNEVAPMLHWHSAEPSLDIRHSANLTGYRAATRYLLDLPYWGAHAALAETLGLEDPEKKG